MPNTTPTAAQREAAAAILARLQTITNPDEAIAAAIFDMEATADGCANIGDSDAIEWAIATAAETAEEFGA